LRGSFVAFIDPLGRSVSLPALVCCRVVVAERFVPVAVSPRKLPWIYCPHLCGFSVQDDTSLFLYKANTFTDVECAFVGADPAVEFPIVFGDTFNVIEAPNDYGCGSFVFVLLDADLQRSTIQQLSCTGKVSLVSERKPTSQRRHLSSGRSSDNDRSLQETPENVEIFFITVTILLSPFMAFLYIRLIRIQE